jgi:hypothetical protein
MKAREVGDVQLLASGGRLAGAKWGEHNIVSEVHTDSCGSLESEKRWRQELRTSDANSVSLE